MVKIRSQGQTSDMKNLIRTVLDSPIRPGPVMYPDGRVPITQLSKANTDVKTRMVLQYAYDAANGDIRSGEFLMKFGCYDAGPANDTELEAPIIVDDLASLDDDPDVPDALGTVSDDDGEMAPEFGLNVPVRHLIPPPEDGKDV